jgi:hypothetical protein
MVSVPAGTWEFLHFQEKIAIRDSPYKESVTIGLSSEGAVQEREKRVPRVAGMTAFGL